MWCLSLHIFHLLALNMLAVWLIGLIRRAQCYLSGYLIFEYQITLLLSIFKNCHQFQYQHSLLFLMIRFINHNHFEIFACEKSNYFISLPYCHYVQYVLCYLISIISFYFHLYLFVWIWLLCGATICFIISRTTVRTYSWNDWYCVIQNLMESRWSKTQIRQLSVHNF